MSRVLRDAFSPGSPACPSSWLLDGGACPGPAAAAVGVDDLAAPPPPGDALYLLQGWRGGVGGGGATDSEQPDLHALVGNEAADVCSVDDGKHAARASRDSGTGTACRPGRAGRGSHARGSSRGAGTASAAAAALKCSRKGATRAQREAHRRYRQRRKTMIAAMEADVAAKQQELLALQQQNVSLRSRTRVLETAQRCSTEIHELMQVLDSLQMLAADDPAVVCYPASDSCSSPLTSPYRSSSVPLLGSAANSAPAAAAAAAAAAGAPGRCSMDAAAALASATQQQQQQQQQQLGVQAGTRWLQHAEQCVSTAGGGDAKVHHADVATHALADTHLTCDQQQQWRLSRVAVGAPAVPGGRHGPAADSWPAGSDSASGSTSDTLSAFLQGAGSGSFTRAASGSAGGGGGAGAGAGAAAAECSSGLLSDVGSVDTAEQGLVIYKAFLQRAGAMLDAAAQQRRAGDAAGAAAIEDAVGELTRTTIGRLQPFLVARGQSVVYDMNARNLETQQPAEPPPGLWQDVLDALQLSAEAQHDALHCYELFAAPLSKLLAERTALLAQYHGLQDSSSGAGAGAGAGAGGSGSGSGTGVPGSAGAVAAAAEAAWCTASASDGGSSVAGAGGAARPKHAVSGAKSLEAYADQCICSAALLKAIAANLERYQSLDGVFAHSLTSLLSGAQIAAACVASYPFLPRWSAMMTCLQTRVAEERAAAAAAAEQAQHPHRRSARQRSRAQQAPASALYA